MKLFILIFILFTQSAFAEYDGYVIIDTKKNVYERTIVDWKTSDNVPESCEKESRKRGFGGFKGSQMEACSFYNFDDGVGKCTIITARKTTLDTIGHEFTHCTQGKWH
jgi:hypothetical protein